jgi:hypothetical protein
MNTVKPDNDACTDFILCNAKENEAGHRDTAASLERQSGKSQNEYFPL